MSFPMYGSSGHHFSNAWKEFFQGLETARGPPTWDRHLACLSRTVFTNNQSQITNNERLNYGNL